MSRPSSNAWVHLRGDDNERTVCGEENRNVSGAGRARGSNFEIISTQNAADVTCPRCCMELIKRREAETKVKVISDRRMQPEESVLDFLKRKP